MIWHGWIWDTRRQRWQQVCEAEALGECSRKLSAIVDARRTKDRYAVLTGGGMPTFRPGRPPAATSAPETTDGPTDAESNS